MINRTIPSPVSMPQELHFTKADVHTLSNGIKLLVINKGDEEVCRIDLVFHAGSRYQQVNLQANAALMLMPEGTTNNTSKQISEHFDFYGSFLNIDVDKDYATLSLSSLIKHFPNCIEMLGEIVRTPVYPDKELILWSQRGKHKLLVELEKTSTLAGRAFFGTLFGKTHPYGAMASPDDYDIIAQPQLRSFHSSRIGSNFLIIILSGKIGEHEIALVEKCFGNLTKGNDMSPIPNGIAVDASGRGKVFVEKPNAVQSAIRVGRILFPRTHPDYPAFLILNTILGGYFGSRLMRNIREDKGFTYGINSFLAPFRHSGVFAIATEVGAAYTEPTLKEIYSEMKRLRNEPIADDELLLVKSYLMGEILRNFNGAFPMANSIIKLLYYNELDYSFYDNLFKTIRTITSDRLMEMANKWLIEEEMLECVAGSRET
ncbi:MAG TPA: pitrilysin family protein [Tenuifilaceae bacterium]|jgi:predicted Zn-dependent peptidase|nr:pitrilysin family protein [Bacteroidales bacterium]MDI9516646.1 pitrilysin family protein [Bacteroidota bacterium]NLH56030.1 insulinase family protein [Rikenellaceae bacterium]OQC63880.1 MAG: Peptidase M16 inactive domain protein [Bacteroidetes bacterium ADurb.Bin008]HNV80696.1 pitrilysin family protein [Tenuifilaceae bacterium]